MEGSLLNVPVKKRLKRVRSSETHSPLKDG